MGDTKEKGRRLEQQQQSFVLVICLMAARPSDIKWLQFWLGLARLGSGFGLGIGLGFGFRFARLHS